MASLQLGEQIKAQWVPLLGLSYDPRADAVEIMLKGSNVTISKPRELHFDGTGSERDALDIVDAEGIPYVVELSKPLMLPAAQNRPRRSCG